MDRRPLFFRPISPGLTEEEEAAEIAEIVRLIEAAFESDAESDEAPKRS